MDRGRDAGGSARHKAAQLRAEAERKLAVAENYEKGAAGEAATAEALAVLPPEFHVFHDLVVPGRLRANVDHLVIGPTGVWLIDSKSSDSDLRYSDGTLWRGGFPMRREVASLEAMAERVARHLDADVRSVLCFTHGQVPVPCPRLGTVTAVNRWQLVDLITRAPLAASQPMVEWWAMLAREMVAPMPAPPPRPVEVLSSASAVMVEPVSPVRTRRSTRAARAERRAAAKAKPSAARSRDSVGSGRGGRSNKSRGSRKSSGSLGELLVRLVVGLVVLAFIMKFANDMADDARKRASGPDAPPTVEAPPNVELNVNCGVPGRGYRVTPKWPGDIEGLKGYRVKLETGLAGEMGLWTMQWSTVELKPLHQLPPGIPIEISMVAEMIDGRRSPQGRGRVVLPPEPC